MNNDLILRQYSDRTCVEWVNPEVALPADGEHVLATYASGDVGPCWYRHETMYWYDRALGETVPLTDSDDMIIAWMPFPAPYEPQEPDCVQTGVQATPRTGL